MAASIFGAITALRLLIETETDANSPDNETTYTAMRVMLETLYKLCFSDGFTGTASANPPDDNTGILTHAGAAQDVDEHNGKTLLITSGNARGNFYTIDDTTAQTITCTGDNLYSDGVRSGDYFEILYDIKTNSDGHDHDGTNSKLLNASVTQSALATSEPPGSVSTPTATPIDVALPGGEYGFYPQLKVSAGTMYAQISSNSFAETSYTTTIYLNPDGGTGYAQQRYVTATGRIHWVFILRDILTKKVLVTWQGPDHPSFGNGGKPKLCPHPFGNYNEEIHEIVVINPTKAQVKEIKEKTIVEDDSLPDLDFIEAMYELYDFEDAPSSVWPKEEISVGLPKNWRDLPMGTKVKSMNKKIDKPEYIKMAKLKKRGTK